MNPRRRASPARTVSWPLAGATSPSGARRLAASVAVAAALVVAGCDGSPTTSEEGRTLVVEAGAGQEGLEGFPLPEEVVVRVREPTGSPAMHVPVDVTAVGGGQVTPSQALTDRLGQVHLTWAMGPATTPGQELRISAVDAPGPVSVQATALPREAADVLILRGAEELPKGVLLMHAHERGHDILLERAATDTLLLLQPRSDETDVVVFPTTQAMEWRRVQWTPGPDTLVVEMRPPIQVDVLVRIFVGPFDTMRAQALTDLARADSVWAAAGMGIRLGAVEVLDRVDPERTLNATGEGACAVPAEERLELNYVHTVIGYPNAGMGCPPGQAFMGAEAGQMYPYLAAHEIGHTWALAHRVPGLMDPKNPTGGVSDGEVFRANFDGRSGLNVLFNAQPEEARRVCGMTLDSCLEATYGFPVTGR